MQSKPILMCWGELHLHQCGFESEEMRTIVWCCEASIYMKQNYTVWPLTRISKKDAAEYGKCYIGNQGFQTKSMVHFST